MLRSVTRVANLASVARVASRRPLILQRSLAISSVKCDPEKPQNKLDEIFPRVEDFPAHHIGPRKWEAKVMLQELGYNVSTLEHAFFGHGSQKPKT